MTTSLAHSGTIGEGLTNEYHCLPSKHQLPDFDMGDISGWPITNRTTSQVWLRATCPAHIFEGECQMLFGLSVSERFCVWNYHLMIFWPGYIGWGWAIEVKWFATAIAISRPMHPRWNSHNALCKFDLRKASLRVLENPYCSFCPLTLTGIRVVLHGQGRLLSFIDIRLAILSFSARH